MYSIHRQLPLESDWDVIVCGGGPSGCTAAISAARQGARTLLVEALGFLGGMATAGLVPAWCPFSDGKQIIYRGLALEVFEQSKRGVPHEPPEKTNWVAVNPEHLKRVYENLALAADVNILYHTMVTAVDTDSSNSVQAIIVANKAGLTALQAKVYVDCTGDADIVYRAGSPTLQGDVNGDMQPASSCFFLSNVNEAAYRKGRLHGTNPASPVYKMIKDERFPHIVDSHMNDYLVGPGIVGFNAGHLWNVDGTDPVSLSQAMTIGRSQAEEFRAALAEMAPEAFANAIVTATPSLMGIRETRRIVGDYMLTADDYLARRSFPDDIARNSYYIDIHPSLTEVNETQGRHIEVVASRKMRFSSGESHGIPYRSLVPQKLKNVLVAGRSISADRMVQGAVRVGPVCLVTGQAAGTAAAQAAQMTTVDVHAVDTDALRKTLKENGAYLP